MNEILKKLLESEILSDDSKQELTEAFDAHIAEIVEETKANAIADVKVELHEQFAREKDQLIEAVDKTINEFIIAEFAALKDDIKAFRDLEAEKAIELAKEKRQLGKTLKEDMSKLVAKLDSFLEERFAAEFKEMRTDLMEAKKADVGRRMVEAFAHEYRKYCVNPNEVERELNEAKVKLNTLSKKYKNVKKQKEDLYRKVRVESVLAPLSGTKRDLMDSILSSVATEKLEEAYKLYLPRVLKDGTTVTESVDSTTMINEAINSINDKLVSESSHIVTGDTQVQRIDEGTEQHPSTLIGEFTRLAGIR